MPDKTPMLDRAIPVLASLEIATSLDYFHKLGFETAWGMDELYVYDPSGSLVKFGQMTDRLIQADAVQETPSDQMRSVAEKGEMTLLT